MLLLAPDKNEPFEMNILEEVIGGYIYYYFFFIEPVGNLSYF